MLVGNITNELFNIIQNKLHRLYHDDDDNDDDDDEEEEEKDDPNATYFNGFVVKNPRNLHILEFLESCREKVNMDMYRNTAYNKAILNIIEFDKYLGDINYHNVNNPRIAGLSICDKIEKYLRDYKKSGK
jgi:hypothetical protein